MARFRFRAQVALEYRRRQFDAARRELADAERVRDEAQGLASSAEAAVADARRSGSAHARQAGTITEWHWYRFWILRLEHEWRAALATLASREALVAQARVACLAAKQRYESLERLREKALAAFDAAEASTERKLIDELATRRFAAGRQNEGVRS